MVPFLNMEIRCTHQIVSSEFAKLDEEPFCVILSLSLFSDDDDDDDDDEDEDEDEDDDDDDDDDDYY